MNVVNCPLTNEIFYPNLALRIRTLSAEELLPIPPRLQKHVLSTTPFAPNQVIVQGERKQVFSFDNVFAPEVSQKEIYDRVVMNMIDKFIEGKPTHKIHRPFLRTTTIHSNTVE